MYYLVLGTSKDGSYDSFEWVVKGNTQEEALLDAKKDLTGNDIVTEIRELTIEDCIERENKDIKYEIERQYLINHYDYENLTVREYNEIKKEFNSSEENYYEAIKEAVKSLRLLRRLGRITNIEEMTVKDLREGLKRLVSAKTENELVDRFQSIIDKYGRKVRK